MVNPITAARWTTLSSFGRAFLQVLQLTILARYLDSAEFAVIAIVSSIIALMQIISDGGVSGAIVHYSDTSKKQLATLFWFNTLVSVILALCLFMASGFLADFYAQPVLKPLLTITSLTLALLGFGQQARVIAQKNFRFNFLAKIDLASALLGASVCLTAAYFGYGVYGVVCGALVSALFSTSFLLVFSGDYPVPRFRLELAEVADYIKFGLYSVATNIVNAVNFQADVMLGVRLIGADAMGYYSVPRDLSIRVSAVINPIVTFVTFPLMAKAKSDSLVLTQMYLKTIRMTSSLNCPISVFMFFYAEDIIFFVLGERWRGSAPLLKAFCVWALVRSSGNPSGTLLLAKGRADLGFKWNLAVMFLFLPCVYAGSAYGNYGIASSIVLFALLSFVPFWYFVIRINCESSFMEYFRQIYIPFIVAVGSVSLSYITTFYVPDAFFRLMGGLLIAGSLYLLGSWRFNKDFYDIVVSFVGRGPASNRRSG